ncbi:penicillin-binding protein 1C [Novimethylophilus kurashikiensis]|uniref:peptidoglycan glycosyltransferase n=1 Tax=Novimethylophilus kurashikiensis TaxID=1825523 RepID=A0A2R5FA81_9PROT|nr:penicillin-binding protein 1C [Novimethylophilus kurashikiensis]GBG13601.1 penicillin-binding protein 1C [Novimethylophilus kurashikiensis]
MKFRRLILIGLGSTVTVLGLSVLTSPMPSFEFVRSASFSSEATLLDRNGVVIECLRLDRKRRMLEWVPLDALSPRLQQAVIAAEDKRFYWHPGIDPLGAISAIADNLHRTRARGASTITMQLANLLAYPDDPRGDRGWLSKLRQVRDALALELRWSKREILEAYLNRVPFRGELIGVDAASRGLLAKGPGGLDTAEAAVLASLVRAPGASRTAIAKRACATLKAMAEDRDSSLLCEQSAFLATALPQRPYLMPGVDDAPHLGRRLLQKPGERLQVAVDASLQRFARETLRTHLAELANQNVEDGAVVVLDNTSGEVLAYIGSSGDLSGAAEVDGVAALRQPGSTLKPFLYGAAIDQGWLNASSVLDDSPLALTTPSGLYIPQDYDRNFRGAVSVRTALGSSLNVPAVRTLTLVGVDRFLNTLRDLGMSSLNQEAEHYGFGLALGGAETTLLQLTNAYRTLANGGQWRPTRFLLDKSVPSTSPAGARQILSPQASFIIADILADPAARTLTFGLSSPLSTHTWAAVKTGTSKAMRDNWAVGFTDRYTVGVWVGNFSGAPMWDVSGVTGAAPVWRDIVEYLHRSHPSQAPIPPQGVTRLSVAYRPAIEAPREEWVIGTNHPPEPAVIRVAGALPTLIAPPDSAVIAPDPDIPQQRQALLLQSNGIGNTCMLLDGKPAARCGISKALVPLPLPGKHSLMLIDGHEKELDMHQFEVRALNTPKHSPAQSREGLQ